MTPADLAEDCLKESTTLTDRGGSLAVTALPEWGAPLAERVDSKPADKVGTGRRATGRTAPGSLERVAAERRVERFLETFGMARGRRREMVIQSCVAHAMVRRREQPGSDLATLALEEAEDALSRWFIAVLGPEIVGEHPPLLAGRAALAICEAAGCWPGVLATCDRLPPVALKAMQRADYMPTPAEEPGAMVDQPLEYWSAKKLLISLRGVFGRGLGGRPASAS